jgi:hypothetical protein
MIPLIPLLRMQGKAQNPVHFISKGAISIGNGYTFGHRSSSFRATLLMEPTVPKCHAPPAKKTIEREEASKRSKQNEF